jgi:hypothetical protein
MSDAGEETGRPWQDPIVAEVRAVRRALFAASGDDIREFSRRAGEAQIASGHVIVGRVSDVGAERAPMQNPPRAQRTG